MPLTSLPDRILAALSRMDAPTVSQMADYINFDIPRVRAAYDELEASGRAKIVRRGNGLHLVPADYPGRICPVCRVEMRKRQYGKTCSKSCGMSFAWRKRDRAKQGDVMRRAWASYSPEKRNEINRKSHRTADYLARFGERNRKDWADPVKRMKRVVGMEAAWQGPTNEPRRARARARKLSLWSDPEWAERTRQAMLTGKRGRVQREVIRLCTEMPYLRAEEIAERTGRTLQQTKILMRRLYRLGKIAHAPEDGRKKKQLDAVVANRVTKTIALRAERRAAL